METINDTSIDEFLTIEQVKVTELKFMLSEDNKLVNGKYRVPQNDLIPSQYWGIDVDRMTFVCSGSSVKSIK